MYTHELFLISVDSVGIVDTKSDHNQQEGTVPSIATSYVTKNGWVVYHHDAYGLEAIPTKQMPHFSVYTQPISLVYPQAHPYSQKKSPQI